jgi:hypothetical protein
VIPFLLHNLVVSRVSNLCEDLVDEEIDMPDVNAQWMVQKVKETKTRGRKKYDKTNVRRSTRTKIKK